jgi:hypothetical protein
MRDSSQATCMLTALALAPAQELQLSVYSNSDALVALDLEVLAPLTRLHLLHLTKQRAYFPQQRCFKVGRSSKRCTVRQLWPLA